MRKCLPMKNTFVVAVMLFAVAIMGIEGVGARQAAAVNQQQPQASSSQQASAPAASTPAAPAAKPQSATQAKPAAKPAAKPGQAAAAKKPDTLELKTDKDKVSYAIGMNIGQNLQKQTEEFDPAIVQRGIRDALAGGKMLMTEDEAKAALTALQVVMRK